MNVTNKVEVGDTRSEMESRSSSSSCCSIPSYSGCSTNLAFVQEEDFLDEKLSEIKSKSCKNLPLPVPVVALKTKTQETEFFRAEPKNMKKVVEKEGKLAENPESNNVSIKVLVTKSSQDLEGSQGCKRFLGIFLGVLAALQFSISALILKVLKFHPFNLSVWRFAVMFFISIPFLLHSMLWHKEKFFGDILPSQGKSRFLIVLQAILGGNSIIFFLFGLRYLNVADCIVIGTSAPVFVTFFAFIFLGEKCGVFPVFTAVIALVGVGIISKPPMLTGQESFNEDTMIGVANAFTCMILLTLGYVIVRHLRNVHHALLNLCVGIWGVVQNLVMAYLFDVLVIPESYHDTGLIILSALLAYSAQTCVTLALKYEQAGPVALVRTTEVVFAFFWQAIFLAVTPDIFSIIGAVLTLSGVVLTTLRKMVMSLPDEHKYKQRFWFLLF